MHAGANEARSLARRLAILIDRLCDVRPILGRAFHVPGDGTLPAQSPGSRGGRRTHVHSNQ